MANKPQPIDATRPVQWKDLPAQGRKVVEKNMSDLGANRTSAVSNRLQALQGATKPKAVVERATLEAVAPHVKDKPITITSAASNRVKLYRRGQDAADARGETVPSGAGWYFGHHADIQRTAHEHGFDTGSAIDASTLMSPQNSPDNEKAAVGALMHAHSSGKIDYTPQVHDALSRAGVYSNPSHVGRVVSGSELAPETLAGMSGEHVRHEVQPHTNIDLKGIGRGGTKTNVVKAVNVLRGDTSFEKELSPLSGPKVSSYREVTRNAVPNTDNHVEYMSRVEHDQAVRTGRQHVGQDMLDLYGKRHSREGILNPEGNTAEDTWMNSISHGQKMATVPGTRASVGKTVGSNQTVGYASGKTAEIDGRRVTAHPDPQVGGTALQHAFNNRATHVAARSQSAGHDFQLPAVTMQEVPWTQARRDANKDPEFGARSRAEAKVAKADAPTEVAGQLPLFADRRRK